jgi:hypothetical protein
MTCPSPGVVHSPNAAWHPAPQYAVVEPQYPDPEQQLPNVDPTHVTPLPHNPSSLGTSVGVAVLVVEVEVVVVPVPVG